MNSAWQLNNQLKGTTVRLTGGIDFMVPKINQPRNKRKTIAGSKMTPSPPKRDCELRNIARSAHPMMHFER